MRVLRFLWNCIRKYRDSSYEESSSVTTDTSLSSSQDCSICMNHMDYTHEYKKYKCIHVFHKQCIDKWSGPCPICRNASLQQEIIVCQNDNVKYFKSMPCNVPIQYYSRYLDLWGKSDCKQLGHSIFFKKTFGVIGVCETCGFIQSFNLMHDC